MTTSPSVLSTPDETTAIAAFESRVAGLQLEPRCHVCRNDEVRQKVNDLLASGASYAMAHRALGEMHVEGVTADSIRRHAERHFPVQNAARATYREILERRAKENSVDFVNGVATAITPMALLETVMVRGYEKLVDPGHRGRCEDRHGRRMPTSRNDRLPYRSTRLGPAASRGGSHRRSGASIRSPRAMARAAGSAAQRRRARCSYGTGLRPGRDGQH